MMSLRNKAIIGRTGKDVEIFNFENGSKKATVTLATSGYYINQWKKLNGSR